MTATWGTPLVGDRTQIPETQEFKVGDRIIARGEFIILMMYDEAGILQLIKTRFDLFEPHFQPKYIAVRQEWRDRSYGWGQDLWVVFEAHLTVIKASPITANLIISIFSVLLMLIVVGVIAWTFWYVGEKTGGAGIILLLLVILVLGFMFLWRGFEFKGKRRKVKVGRKT